MIWRNICSVIVNFRWFSQYAIIEKIFRGITFSITFKCCFHEFFVKFCQIFLQQFFNKNYAKSTCSLWNNTVTRFHEIFFNFCFYLFHDVINTLWTAFRSFHSVAFFNMFHNVGQRYSGIRYAAKWINFPQQDSKTPHVTFAGEFLCF